MKEEIYAPLYRKFCKKLAEIKNGRPNRFLMIMTSFYAFCLYVTSSRFTSFTYDSSSQASRSLPEHDAGIESDDDGWQVIGPDSEDDEPLH